MFHLFGEDAQDRVSECQKKKDWAGLAKAYYDMGVAAMDQKDLNRAVLWLHRADTIYSADDAVYDKVGGKRLWMTVRIVSVNWRMPHYCIIRFPWKWRSQQRS